MGFRDADRLRRLVLQRDRRAGSGGPPPAVIPASYSGALCTFDFAGSTNAPKNVVAGLRVGGIFKGPSLVKLTYDVDGAVPSSPLLHIEGTGTTAAAAISANQFHTFSLIVLPGATLSLTSLVLKVGRGGSSTTRGFVVRSSIDNYTADLLNTTVAEVAPTLGTYTATLSTVPALQNLPAGTLVTFRIYTFTGGGTLSMRFDDITPNGTVTGDAGAFPGLGLSGGPNLPGGLTPIFAHSFDQIGDTDGAWRDAGAALGEYQLSGSQFSLAPSASSPSAVPGKVLLVKLANLLEDGNAGFAQMQAWKDGKGANIAAGGAQAFSPASELYVRFRIRVLGPSSNPDAPGTDYQNQGVCTKIGYGAYGNTSRFNHCYFNLKGTALNQAAAPHGSLMTQMTPVWNITQMDGAGADPGNSSGYDPQGAGADTTKKIVVGQWHEVEMYMKKNTGDNSDGIGKMWVDSVLTHNFTTLKWTSTANPLGFYLWNGDVVWGGDYGAGAAGQIKDRDDWIALDDFFMAAA